MNDLGDAKLHILGGADHFSPSPCLPHFVDHLRTCRNVLDFGCGVGRNMNFLVSHASPGADIYGYDFDNMHTLARSFLSAQVYARYRKLRPPPACLADIPFDFVVAFIVFQHFGENELCELLSSLNLKPGGIMLVRDRGWMDDGRKNTWKILKDYFYSIDWPNIPAIDMDKVEGSRAAVLRQIEDKSP